MAKANSKLMSSMTGFARKTIEGAFGGVAIEIRSVNQRFLETYFRIPEDFRGLEGAFKELLRKQLTRGKVECQLKINLDGQTATNFNLDEAYAKKIIDASNWIIHQAGHGQLNPIEVLNWPGVLKAPRLDLEEINKVIIALFEETLIEFIAVRQREGELIKETLLERLSKIQVEIIKVRDLMPDILSWQKNKFLSKFEELKLEIDQTRLEQELLFIAQRSDVAEELDRLDMHIKEMHKILEKPDAVGRRLDFMMQEFNREANTLASKSINTQVTQSAVEIKVLIEQMREQIQNIE